MSKSKKVKWSTLFAVFCFFLLVDVAAGELPRQVTWNFETGNLQGWIKQGTAFDFQPTYGDNPTARRRGQPSHHEGRYWIGGFEMYQGLPGQRPGATQGDRPTGTLSSPHFTIPAGTLSFLVGGGSSFKTRVELIVSGQRALYASGRNTETMHRVTWNLAPYAGKSGYIRIVDEASGGWGHINADDFRFSQAEPAPVSNSVHLTGRWLCDDGGSYFVRQIGNEIWWHGLSRDGGATWSNVFHGRLDGRHVNGRWADVPQGRIQGSGELTLQVFGNNQFKATRKTGGFGGSEWTR
jgi:hypothetical protein